jgi:hypothetical protein
MWTKNDERHPDMGGAMACPRPAPQTTLWGKAGRGQAIAPPISGPHLEDFVDGTCHASRGGEQTGQGIRFNCSRAFP